jgi:hypothetical protein
VRDFVIIALIILSIVLFRAAQPEWNIIIALIVLSVVLLNTLSGMKAPSALHETSGSEAGYAVGPLAFGAAAILMTLAFLALAVRGCGE